MADRAKQLLLRNIGPVSAEWLVEVGITTRESLEQAGAVTAYAMVCRRYPQASINLLWALEAGLRDIDWRELTDEVKAELRQQLENLRG